MTKITKQDKKMHISFSSYDFPYSGMAWKNRELRKEEKDDNNEFEHNFFKYL
jgi:hypothetical protein